MSNPINGWCNPKHPDCPVSKQAEQIAQLSACIDSVLVVAADYDGYTTVEGFKKLVYRLASIASSRRPEEIQKGYDNES